MPACSWPEMKMSIFETSEAQLPSIFKPDGRLHAAIPALFIWLYLVHTFVLVDSFKSLPKPSGMVNIQGKCYSKVSVLFGESCSFSISKIRNKLDFIWVFITFLGYFSTKLLGRIMQSSVCLKPSTP